MLIIRVVYTQDPSLQLLLQGFNELDSYNTHLTLLLLLFACCCTLPNVVVSVATSLIVCDILWMPLKTAPHSNTKFKEFFSSIYLFFSAFIFATKRILCTFCPLPKAHTYLVFSSALANMTKRQNLPEANQTHKVCVGEPGEWLLVA